MTPVPKWPPRPPRWLDAEARAEWRRVCTTIPPFAPGVEAAFGPTTLALYCSTVSDIASLRREMAESPKLRRILRWALRRAEEAKFDLAEQLGLTPATRRSPRRRRHSMPAASTPLPEAS